MTGLDLNKGLWFRIHVGSPIAKKVYFFNASLKGWWLDEAIGWLCGSWAASVSELGNGPHRDSKPVGRLPGCPRGSLCGHVSHLRAKSNPQDASAGAISRWLPFDGIIAVHPLTHPRAIGCHPQRSRCQPLNACRGLLGARRVLVFSFWLPSHLNGRLRMFQMTVAFASECPV